MALLGRVDPKNSGERERMIRFLMDAGWYSEAKKELDRLVKDFPGTDLSTRAAGAAALHGPGRGQPAAVRDRPAAGRPSSTRPCRSY